MRALLLAITAMLLLTTALATPASAAPTCDESVHADGAVVSVHVAYGRGCIEPTLKVCTFGLDPTTPDGCRYI